MVEDGSKAAWPAGLADPDAYGDHVVDTLHRVFDLARRGRVDNAVDRLEADLGPAHGFANAWRPGGHALFTLLHHAAWHGADASTVARLIGMGAFLRVPDARGRTPGDVAREQGHAHLAAVLPASADAASLAPDAVLTEQLHQLVTGRIRTGGLSVRLRPLPVSALADLPATQPVWMPVPGMYGGFSVRRRERHLYVESWSRVVGGSGKAHVVLESGSHLVHSGFV